MVDEACGAADVHAVADVLVRDVVRVQPELVAVGVVVDGPFAVTDLAFVPFDFVGVEFEEFVFGDGFGFGELIEVHEVVAFVRVAGFAAVVCFLGGDDLAAVGIDELTLLQLLQAA